MPKYKNPHKKYAYPLHLKFILNIRNINHKCLNYLKNHIINYVNHKISFQ